MVTPHLDGAGPLIAAIPLMLGFAPRESVVAVGVGDRAEVVALVRVDRADLADPALAEPLARSMVNAMRRDGARALVAVAFTEQQVRVGCRALDAVAVASDAAGLPCHAWAASGGRFFAPGCAQQNCCPSRGRAVPRAAEAAPRAVRGFQHEPARVVPPRGRAAAEADRRRAARAGDRWRAHEAERWWRRASVERWLDYLTAAREGRHLSDADAGKVIAAAQDISVRDAMIVSLTPGGADRARRAARGTGGAADVARAMEHVLSADHATPPDPRVVDAAWAALDRLTALARHTRRVPLLTIGAILAWWEGSAPAAADMARAALAIDPDYRLAALVATTIEVGVEPGWRRAA